MLTKTRRYIDRGRRLEKQRKRLRGRGGGGGEGLPSPSSILNPSTSPLKTLFDSSELSVVVTSKMAGQRHS